jgi:protein-S-isoprenylcysteine O-methyltransferase Ste14
MKMQHPGYTGGLACTLGILLLFGRFDGGIGCYVPAYWRTLATVLHITFVATVMISIVIVRVSEEEAMLRRTFGDEWESYHRNTRRFVPGLF